MKFCLILFVLPVLGLCQNATFRTPPNCFGEEDAIQNPNKCVSTMQNCGGGTYANNVCTCKTGYIKAGLKGRVCIPQCSGNTSSCASAGGNCTAVNFCSCGLGRTFSNAQCISSTSDACGG